VARPGKDERPGHLDGGRRSVAGRGDANAALLDRHHVDRGVARPGRGDQLEPRKALDDLTRQRRSFPHHADRVEPQQPFDDRIRIVDVIVADGDFGPAGDGGPVRYVKRDIR
jgi:hypothetical protein